MNRRRALKALAGLALCPLCPPSGFAAEGAHWSYEGGNGPAKWGDLDAANKVCAIGAQQSPIDIVADQIAAAAAENQLGQERRHHRQQRPLHPAQFRRRLHARGRQCQIQIAAGPLPPAERAYDRGKSYPMEAHFVHRAESGALAVVGVLMSTGKANAAFAKVVSTMPAKEGPPVKADAGFNPNAMLPSKLGYYRYPGSLTTPPCAETVEWLLLANPITVAEADVAGFAKLYPLNARPVQRDNRRYVLMS
jgi:carbonic anhydrase